MSNNVFRKYQPLCLRLWHWLNAIAISGLIGTVFLRKTFLSWRTNSALIETKLKEAGTVVTPELAKDIAVAIRNPLWDWHVNIGLALVVLLIARFAVAAFVEKRMPWEDVIKPASLYYKIVKAGHSAFYLFTFVMAVSGLLLTFKEELGLSKDLVGTVKETHELLMWFFVVFVAGHLVGLVKAENTTDPGLVSDMIHGGERGSQ